MEIDIDRFVVKGNAMIIVLQIDRSKSKQEAEVFFSVVFLS